ncbi:hypothetical protein, partial [Corynebacterium xerosis]|uniref:hypothetical protein n=1 Tax=Corynebacterium xerosis TaxID=1725 RepID=UPI0027BA4149
TIQSVTGLYAGVEPSSMSDVMTTGSHSRDDYASHGNPGLGFGGSGSGTAQSSRSYGASPSAS